MNVPTRREAEQAARSPSGPASTPRGGGPALAGSSPMLCPRRGSRRAAAGALVPGLVVAGAMVAGLLAAPDATTASGEERPGVTLVQGRTSAILSEGELLVRLPWGDGPGEVGLAAPPEGLSRGPESLAVSPEGSLFVLDSVNRRLLTLTSDGSVERTVPIPLRYPRFLAVDEDRAWVLDIDEDRVLAGLDRTGHQVASYLIAPPRQPVTGLFVQSGRVLIETGHDRVVALPAAPAADGRATDLDALPAAPGRPTPPGSAVAARLDPGAAPAVEVVRAGGSGTRAGLSISPGRPIDHLVALGGDARGNLFLGARLPQSPAPVRVAGLSPGTDGSREMVAALVVTQVRKGLEPPFRGGPTIADSLLLPESQFAEVGEPYIVAPDGSLYQPLADADGYTIRIHRFPEEATA